MKLQAREAEARAAVANKHMAEALWEHTTPVARHAVLQAPKCPCTEDTCEFYSYGECIKPMDFQGFDFIGLIYHNRVDRRYREKIVQDEFFELYKLYKLEESSEQYVSMNEEGYLSFNVHKPTQPKRKAEIFSLLYDFGQFYLQIYPAKTAGFLEYLHYLTENTSDMTVQGVLKLDTAIRWQYVNYPHWNWEQSRHEINCLLPMFKVDKNNLLVTASSRHPNKPVRSRPLNKNRPKPSFSKFATSRPDTTPKTGRCRNYNYKSCKFGNKCFREHVCCKS